MKYKNKLIQFFVINAMLVIGIYNLFSFYIDDAIFSLKSTINFIGIILIIWIDYLYLKKFKNNGNQ
ncbi:hypothetical protein COSHB9_13470 [Companilactobacillus alimentarius]|uniref:Uncharacterized protein n=1 Tax=Companilactobacillus alimentarius DSM 20249 TaxID=1423720 RepID=A0A2K9HGC4_9LACO|nr:hypothetical protein LA20249_00735 [Companilactobacillus alimentarius DSM 20249]GEO45227.1 hypothetical protein LAL01_14590 [Companilactobacillus alimentarius]